MLFVDQVAYVHLIRAVFSLDELGIHLGKGVAVIGVVVGEAFGVFLHDRQREIVIGLLPVIHLDDFKHFFFAVDDVSGKDHVAHGIAGAFVDHKGDVNAIVLVVDLGCAHLNVDVAFIEAIGGNGVGVALKVFFFEHARACQPRKDAARLEGKVFVKVATVELVEAINVHFFDVELVALVHVDDQNRAARALAVFKTVVDLGKVVAFLAVQLGNFLQVVGKHLLVEHVARSRAHGGNNVFLVDAF